jgi:hypothetical protein
VIKAGQKMGILKIYTKSYEFSKAADFASR